MKHRLTTAIAVALMAPIIITSCSKDKTTIEAKPEYSPISLVPARINVSSKAPLTGTTFPTSRAIVLSSYHNAASGQGTSANYFEGITFSYSTSKWYGGKYWPANGTLDFLGYSVETASNVSSVTWGTNVTGDVTLTLADNSTNQDDLLVGCVSGKSKVDVPLVFDHAESLVEFKGSSSVAYDSEKNKGITITKITVNGAKYSGTVKATRSGDNLSFAWSNLGSSKNRDISGISSANLTATQTVLGNSLLLPSQDQVSFTVYYTVHNGKNGSTNVDSQLSYTYSPVANTQWEPGKKYTYGISITMSEINVTATLTDWEDVAVPVNI